MQRLFYIFILLIATAAGSYAQQSSALDSIRFSALEYEEALALARSENKPLCVFISDNDYEGFPKQKISLNSQICSLFNQNFINYKLRIGSKQSWRFFPRMHIRGLPWSLLREQYLKTLLFFDTNENLIHVGDFTNCKSDSCDNRVARELAQEVIESKNLTNSYLDRFDRGDRNPEFLIKYGTLVAMTDSIRFDGILKSCAQFFKTDESKVNSFTIHAVTYYHLPYRHSLISGFLRQLQVFESKFGTERVRYAGQFLNFIDMDTTTYTLTELKDIRKYSVLLGNTHVGAISSTYKKTFAAYVREGNSKDWVVFADTILKEANSPYDRLAYNLAVMSTLNQTMWDKEHFEAFKKWGRAITEYLEKYSFMIPSENHALLNYEMAEIYWRHGKKTKAGNLAREAFILSKKPDSMLTPEEKQKIETQFSKYDPRRRNFYVY